MCWSSRNTRCMWNVDVVDDGDGGDWGEGVSMFPFVS